MNADETSSALIARATILAIDEKIPPSACPAATPHMYSSGNIPVTAKRPPWKIAPNATHKKIPLAQFYLLFSNIKKIHLFITL